MNAAYRLATLLEELTRQQQSKVLASVMATALSMPPEGPDYLMALANCMVQMEQVRQAVSATGPSERAMAIHNRAIDKLAPFFRPAHLLNNSVSVLKQNANEIDQLFVMGDMLPKESDIYSADEISAAITDIRELQVKLASLNIDDTLRGHLLLLLDTLIMSLRSHHILGAQGVAKTFGAVAFEMTRVSNTAGAPLAEAKGWFGETMSVLKKIGAAVVWAGAVAGGAAEIADFGGEMLAIGFGDADLDGDISHSKKQGGTEG